MIYKDIFKDRLKVFNSLQSSPKRQAAFKAHYKNNHIDLINDWGVTYDPRNDGIIKPKLMPFILWKRQKELIEWLVWMRENKQRGIIDKARGVGATWVFSANCVCDWLLEDGYSAGIGSRKADLVDRAGDQGSIFEKIGMFINNLPVFLRPKNYDSSKCDFYMRILNPGNGSTITGESGSNIGRGGRTSIYGVDEAAFTENEESIEASLSENTDCQIDISTHNGTNTLFFEKSESYKDKNIFVMEWTANETRDQTWYNNKKAEKESVGLGHIFAQEVDRNPGATLQNVVIPKIWVDAAIDAHLKLDLNWHGRKISGLDVADDGSDFNAQIIRDGFIIEYAENWSYNDSDTAITTRKAIDNCKTFNCLELNYDAIGVGSGVKATSNELYRANKLKIRFNPFKGSERVDNPDTRLVRTDRTTNKQVYSNLKAQYWWLLRIAFENTYKAINRQPFNRDNIISLSSKIKNLTQLKRELSQAQFEHNQAGLIRIKKSPDGKKSPNIADSLVISWRVPKTATTIITPLSKENARAIYK